MIHVKAVRSYDSIKIQIDRGACVWDQDGPDTKDGETIELAYKRITGHGLNFGEAILVIDFYGSTLYSMPSGYVVWVRYPTSCRIYK